MPTTGPWSITTLTSAASLVPLEGLLNSIAQNVANAMTAGRVVQAVNSASARAAKFPSPTVGDRVLRTDLGLEEMYYNGGWKLLPTRFVGARLRKNIAQSTSTSANTSVTWNSSGAEYDTDGLYSTGTNTRLNIPYAGIWLVSFTLRASGTLGMQARIGINGSADTSTEWGSGGASGGATTVGGTDLLSLSAGDYIYVGHEMFTPAGSSFNTAACRFQAQFMGQI